MAKQYIIIKNHGKFQHYKERKPIWIKFYLELLDNDDPYDTAYTDLTDTEKCHLHHLWLLAAKCDNRIPYVEKWLNEKLNIKSKLSVKALIDSGFISVVDENDTELIKPAPQLNKPASKPKKYECSQDFHIKNATIQDIKKYADGLGFAKLDPQEFMDHYSSQDWKKSNGRPLTDWRAGVRAWFRRAYDKPAEQEKQLGKVYNAIVIPLVDELYAKKNKGIDIGNELDAVYDKYRDYKKYKGKNMKSWVLILLKRKEQEDSTRPNIRKEIENSLKQTGEK